MRSHASSSSLEAFGCISMSISGACPSPCGLKLRKLALNELKAPTPPPLSPIPCGLKLPQGLKLKVALLYAALDELKAPTPPPPAPIPCGLKLKAALPYAAATASRSTVSAAAPSRA